MIFNVIFLIVSIFLSIVSFVFYIKTKKKTGIYKEILEISKKMDEEIRFMKGGKVNPHNRGYITYGYLCTDPIATEEQKEKTESEKTQVEFKVIERSGDNVKIKVTKDDINANFNITQIGRAHV